MPADSSDRDAGLRYSSAAGRWVLLATVLGSGMASIDATVVGIALPTIGRQFHASVPDLQWIVTGYLLALSSLLLVGGTLGDQFGRRKAFLVGVAWFTVASAACSVAPDAAVLVVTRIVQGAGAALLVPGSLAIIQATFAEEDRGRAIGAWSGLSGLATAAGPLLGGYLISALSWRWIFIINIPVGAAVLLVGARHVPESDEGDGDTRVDVGGGILAVVALAGITNGLIDGPSLGWGSGPVVASMVVGIAAAAGFVAAERRVGHPMVPLAVFRQRQFTVTNVLTLFVYAALGGVLFLLPVELQTVDGFSPFRAGAALIPVTLIMLALSARSGRLAGRIGPRLQMSAGPLVVGAGLALLARASSDSSYWSGVLPAVVVFGLGLAVTVAPLTATALGSVPADHAGLASAVNNDVARIGGLVAVAVLPALAGLTGSQYLHRSVMAPAFRTAAFIGASWCVVGGLVSAAGIRNPPRRRATVESCLHCALDATPATEHAVRG